jgi:hypothetical protein
MKIERSMKERICSNEDCKKTILKGMFYGQNSKTVLRDKAGQSFNNGKTWSELRILKQFDWCYECALKKGGKK